jgi:FemAB-related protein (PEP-CTERM system-associated)
MSERLTVHPPNGDAAAWDAFVAGSAGATFCHLAAWREIMSDVLGHECTYLVATDGGGAWQGVLPLVRVRGLWGHYLLSMPFLNAGGPVGTVEAQQALAGHAVNEARALGADLLELRTRQAIPWSWRTSHRKITVRLPLPDSAETLWHAFPPKLRSQIRRPLREGLLAQFGPGERDAFYEVFARNMKDLGTPVLPRGFFERVAAAFGDRVLFGVVYRGNEPVAAGCGFTWRDEFELMWASALRRYSPSAPNMLLYWSLLAESIAYRVRIFDFGRCSPNSGSHRFKQQWGGEDVPLEWSQWSPANVTATPSPERPVYRLAGAVWRRLPLVVANRLGPVLARQLP